MWLQALDHSEFVLVVRKFLRRLCLAERDVRECLFEESRLLRQRAEGLL